MNETEIERLVIRLIGDGSSYQKMLQQAQTATLQSAKIVENAAKQIENFQKSLQGYAQTALGVLGMVGIGASFTSMFHQFEEFEGIQIRLRAALSTTTSDVKGAADAYNAYAVELSKTTTLSRTQALSMMQHAASLGIAGDKIQVMMKQAAYLSAATGTSAETAMRGLTRYSETGKVQSLAWMLGLRGLNDETKALEKVNRLLQAGQVANSELMETAGVRLEKLKVAFKDVSIEIGGMIAEGLKPLLDIIEGGVKAFKNLDPAVRKVIVWAVIGTVALASMGIAFKLLGVWQLASSALWLVWQIASTVAITAFNIAMFIATSAVTTFGLSLLLIPVILIAIVAGISAISLAITGFASMIVTLWEVGRENLGRLRGVFEDLKLAIDVIMQSIKTGDWETAQKAFMAGWKMITSYIQMLWPPLWEYIKNGFSNVAIYVWNNFKNKFLEVMYSILDYIDVVGLKDALGIKFDKDQLAKDIKDSTDKLNEQMGSAGKNLGEEMSAALGDEKSIAALKARLGEVTQKAKDTMEVLERDSSGASRKIRILEGHDEAVAEMERLQNLLKTAEEARAKLDTSKKELEHIKRVNDLVDAMRKKAGDVPLTLESGMNKATKAVQHFEAALYGSAEAAKHVEEYLGKVAAIQEEAAKKTAEGGGMNLKKGPSDTELRAAAGNIASIEESTGWAGKGFDFGKMFGFSKGGTVKYFASGGPSGTDTVPAWLSPGEYVTPAGMTPTAPESAMDETNRILRDIRDGQRRSTPQVEIGLIPGGGLA